LGTASSEEDDEWDENNDNNLAKESGDIGLSNSNKAVKLESINTESNNKVVNLESPTLESPISDKEGVPFKENEIQPDLQMLASAPEKPVNEDMDAGLIKNSIDTN